MIRRLVEFCVDARVWVVAVTLMLATGALLLGVRLRLDALPDLTNNQVIVLTRAPGLTPEEIERFIAWINAGAPETAESAQPAPAATTEAVATSTPAGTPTSTPTPAPTVEFIPTLPGGDE